MSVAKIFSHFIFWKNKNVLVCDNGAVILMFSWIIFKIFVLNKITYISNTTAQNLYYLQSKAAMWWKEIRIKWFETRDLCRPSRDVVVIHRFPLYLLPACHPCKQKNKIYRTILNTAAYQYWNGKLLLCKNIEIEVVLLSDFLISSFSFCLN